MAVPKKKTTPSKRGSRRSHRGLDKVHASENTVTGTLHRPHHVSPDGYYKGRQVTTDSVSH